MPKGRQCFFVENLAEVLPEGEEAMQDAEARNYYDC